MRADLLQKPIQFLKGHEGLLVTVSAVSLGLFVLGALAGPFIVARLPEDYFVAPPRSVRDRSPGRIFLWVLRNLLGVALVLVGIALLVLPGQGALTILAGVFFMDVPAKQALLRRFARSERVRRSLNWIRERLHRAPLRFEER